MAWQTRLCCRDCNYGLGVTANARRVQYTPSTGSVQQTDGTMTNADGKIGSRGLVWIVVALVTTGERRVILCRSCVQILELRVT